MSNLNNPFLDKLELDAREHDSERFDVISSYENSNVTGLSRYLPPERVPEGKVLGWMTEYIYGQFERDNMRDVFRKGWEPVPASMFPEFMEITIPEEMRYTNFDYNYIRDKGAILCMMDKDLYQKRAKEFEKEDARNNISIEHRMKNNRNFLGAPTFVKEQSSSRTFGM